LGKIKILYPQKAFNIRGHEAQHGVIQFYFIKIPPA